MDFLAELLKEQAPQLVSALTQETDLTREQAERFVPEAANETVSAIQKSEGLDLGDLLDGGSIAALLTKIDVAGLASRLGLGESQVTQGLQSIVPAILKLLQAKGGGLEGVMELLGGKDASGLLSGAGKLAGKLFGS